MARIEPWVAFTQEALGQVLTGSPVESMISTEDLAFAVVALYLGVELLAHLNGQLARAERLVRCGRPVGLAVRRHPSQLGADVATGDSMARPIKDEVTDSLPPWYAPERISRPVMLHRWESLSFLHWPYPADSVQALLPPGLHVDTFDGAAWVGLIPFRLTVTLPGVPPLPWLSSCPEINVRTYVRGPDGRTGIWFLSLEASRLDAVLTARQAYGLPWRCSSPRGGGCTARVGPGWRRPRWTTIPGRSTERGRCASATS